MIGVHTPEYAFERETRNVSAGIKDHGIQYPVALDNSYATWTAYRNRFWPAQYLIDAQGNVRHIQQGEGGYALTEKLVRSLLSSAQPGKELPAPVETGAAGQDGALPQNTTRETFLGVSKQVNYSGAATYRSGRPSSPTRRRRLRTVSRSPVPGRLNRSGSRSRGMLPPRGQGYG